MAPRRPPGSGLVMDLQSEKGYFLLLPTSRIGSSLRAPQKSRMLSAEGAGEAESSILCLGPSFQGRCSARLGIPWARVLQVLLIEQERAAEPGARLLGLSADTDTGPRRSSLFFCSNICTCTERPLASAFPLTLHTNLILSFMPLLSPCSLTSCFDSATHLRVSL